MADAQVELPPTAAHNIRPESNTSAALTLPNSSRNANSAVFEFTKRKKWADLLVTELAGTIILVLSPTGEVLYCGAAAVELLGWKEEEVIDTELANWMHEDDVAPFLAHFDQCIASHSEMSTFARLRGKASNDARWPVFELRGHPNYDQDMREVRCFFAMARPYPSRNTAMLDSFLELKVENERLRQRLVDLRPSASSYPPAPYISGASISNTRGGGADVMLPTDNSLSSMALNTSLGVYSNQLPRAYQSHYFPPLKSSNGVSNNGHSLDETSHLVEHGQFGSLKNSGTGPRTRPRDDTDTDGASEAPRKKKARKGGAASAAAVEVGSSSKVPVAPQYVCVTCGRTDSPEWRKGPNGAKTLCNACGLRWAKRNQKKKAESAAANGDDDAGKDMDDADKA